MDGVIIDSEPLHYKVEKKIFEEYTGIFDPEFHKEFIGVPDTTMWASFKERFNVAKDIDYLLNLKLDLFIEEVDEVAMIEGVRELLKLLYKDGYDLALATSNGRRVVDIVINKFGLDKYLKFSISGDEVIKGKPNPEMFLKVAKELKVDPSESLVIEDSENGVKAAKAAKMKCIGYLNINSGEHDLSMADIIIDNYSELNINEILKLF